MKYKDFVLDQFQEDAIKLIEKNHSVVVSAATGTGKTLIADYIIEKFRKEDKKIFYTAPIKALSNQKYRDFKKEFGEEHVGILTGDVSINSNAKVLIMTTEIYRNMLLSNDKIIDDLSYVIFDEIHYINDIERGTIWEESIIFSPEHVRFLCLSATIPNAEEFADWIKSIKEHEVNVVRYEKRAVPLMHYVYDTMHGWTTLKELKEDIKMEKHASTTYYRGRKSYKKEFVKAPSHLDLLKEIERKDQVPCIFFTFSRLACETKANELAKKKDFATNEEKVRIIQIFNQYLSSEIKTMDSVGKLKAVVQKGIAYHHAGILPNLKEIVERLFGEGLIKVLYATETFAVGINMPAKTVVFNSLRKYDGIQFRNLNSKEYFQLAGRAGRRGIDKEGYAIAMIDRRDLDIDQLMRVTSKDVDPIISQFALSYNTVLNLLKNHKEEEIMTILKSNFDYYLRRKANKSVRILASYNHKIKVLKNLGYMDGFGLTVKGMFATGVYSNELLVSEIFGTELHKELSEVEMLTVLGAISFERRRNDRFSKRNVKEQYVKIMRLLRKNSYVEKNINDKNIRDLIPIISLWANGGQFEDLVKLSNMQEGDYIRFFRQIIDMLRQIRHSTQDADLQEKVNNCLSRIDRDVIKVVF